MNMSTLVELVDLTEKTKWVHNINTKLLSILLPQLRSLQELAFKIKSTNYNHSYAEYRATAIVLVIASYRLFRPAQKLCSNGKATELHENQIFEQSCRCHPPSSSTLINNSH